MEFTEKDISIVRLGMQNLLITKRQILYLRYWENHSIEEIASMLDMSWDEVDRSIEEAQEELKEFCLNHPGFSLADYFELEETA